MKGLQKNNKKIDHDGCSDEAAETDHEEDSDDDKKEKAHTEEEKPQMKNTITTYVHEPGSYEIRVPKKTEKKMVEETV